MILNFRGDVMKFEVKTGKDFELIDITAQVKSMVKESNVKNGLALIFTKHTTTGVLLNENEPGLIHDFMEMFLKLVPKGAGYRHDIIDRNAHSHLLASLIGQSQVIPVENGELLLGTWQKIFLVELDGPRARKVVVKVIGG